jgi:hypothetical protein
MASTTFNAKPARQGLWFPLALSALLLLAVPGAVLLALSLLGYENTVNGWLQRRFALSYHTPIPWWAALVVLLLPVLLILLYFLKLRRKPLEVPSTFLWKKSIEDLHVNSLFQWLRNNVLLLVQLLTVLLLIYALLAFQVHGSTVSGKYYILLIDNSASMSATDVSPNRLEVAREEALKEIDAHAEGDTGMVIEFNSRATILQPYTRDRELLRSAVRRITQTQRPTRIDEALDLADSLANPTRSADDSASRPAGEDPSKARTYVAPEGFAAEVHLFSDGRFPDVPQFAAGNLSLNYHRIGKPGPDAVDNIGIVDFNVVRDEQNPSLMQVFLRVLNYRPRQSKVTVRLQWRIRDQIDFQIREKEVELAGRSWRAPNPEKKDLGEDKPGEKVVTFDLADIEDGTEVLLEASLEGLKDQFALDNRAWLVAGVVRKARVLIVTPGNAILRDFFDLEETSRVATVKYLKPDELKDEAKYGRPAGAGEFDLVIFDRCAPADEKGLPNANTFFIAAVPPPWKREEMPPLEKAVIRNATSSHPLMRHLSGLDEIAFDEAFRFPLNDKRVPPRTPRLLETDRETAVLFVLARHSFQDLVLAFPLVDDKGLWPTNWSFKLSFPIFLRNVLYEMGHISDSAADENVQPGRERTIRPEQSVDRLEVVGPGEKKWTVKRSAGQEFVFHDTDRVGLYRADWAGGTQSFAVNLLDQEESNLQPRDEIKLGLQTLAAGESRRQTYDTWKWVALAALALLVLEWAFYHRRIFV